MALELNKLTTQVDAMGRAMASRGDELRERASRARELLFAQPEVSEELQRKIETARRIDEWRRGAIPLSERLDERHGVGAAATPFTLIAADGSQIYPDRHAIATYYLLNTGTIVFRAGSGEAPSTASAPELFFEEADLYDEDGMLRSTDYIGAQRNRRELKALADLAEAEREALGGDTAVPIVAMVDGPLLPWMRSDPANQDAINREIDYFGEQMGRLRRAGAIPVGYIDRPGSAYVLRILELIDLPIHEITRQTLRQGRFRGLADRQLFADLQPNERTGLFTPNSDANDRYAARPAGGGDRIAFAYVNVARRPGSDNSAICRIEVPGWVAADSRRLDIAQACIYANCEPAGYSYVLARAHELAVVAEAERTDLEAMLFQAMLRNGLMPELSLKATNKAFTARFARS